MLNLSSVSLFHLCFFSFFDDALVKSKLKGERRDLGTHATAFALVVQDAIAHDHFLPVVIHVVPEPPVTALDAAQELDGQVVAHEVTAGEVVLHEEALLVIPAKANASPHLDHSLY